MPYKNIDDLPAAVKNNLPSGAQEIYKNAYNKADGDHSDWSASKKAQYAWGAVKRVYKKDGDKWVKKKLAEGLPYDVTNDEFTLEMPADPSGWARVYFQIPPEAWEKLSDEKRSEYISQIPVGLAATTDRLIELEVQRLSWDGTTQEDEIRWIRDDISSLWNKLWSIDEQKDTQIEAIGKRIDDLVAIIGRLGKNRELERLTVSNTTITGTDGNTTTITIRVPKQLSGYLIRAQEPLTWQKVGNVLELEGTLIAEGVWTGIDGETVFYPRTIFPYAASSIVGAQIKRGHNDTDNDVIGFVTAARAVDDRINIKGMIFDTDSIDLVATGTLGGISMEAEVQAEWSDERSCWFATELNLRKATLVENPACEPCRVSNLCVVALQKANKEKGKERKMSADHLKLLENPLFKDVVAVLQEASVGDVVTSKVLDILRKAVKAQNDVTLTKEIEDLKAQILAKNKELDDLKAAVGTEKTSLEKARDDLATQKAALEKELTDIRTTEVNGLLAQIKVIDKDFNEKDLIAGVPCLVTQKTLLQKVLTTVAKLSKTIIQVNTIPVEMEKAEAVLLEMGIPDVKKFIEG